MITATYTEPDEPTIQRLSYVEGLIRNSTFDHETQAQMERDLRGMTEGELLDMELRLIVNQLDNIFERGNYSQTELKNRLK